MFPSHIHLVLMDSDPNCSFPHITFRINCSNSFNPPRPFIGGLQVVEITDSHVRVRHSFQASNCFNSTGGLISRNRLKFFTGSTYLTVSDVNVFRVTGCDDFALIEATRGKRFASGCAAVCWNDTDVQNEDSCSGIGCCEIKFPKGVKDFNISLRTFNFHTQAWSFNRCGYAFLGEEKKFIYGGASDLSDLSYKNRTLENVPLVLDWVIGDKTCENVSNSNDYACLGNSHCVDSDTEFGGYRCECNGGFEGNPYLGIGCTDIDECTSDEGNLCEKKCHNADGNYSCSCPDGYYGDGYKNSTGCTTKNNSRILKLSLG